MRNNPYTKNSSRPGRFLNSLGLAVWFVALVATATAVFVVVGSYNRASKLAPVAFEGEAVNLGTVERFFLSTYLTANASKLEEPAGAGNSPVEITIMPGESAEDITDKLGQSGIVKDRTLFSNYIKFFGIDSRLEAGTYILSPRMTVPELASTLTKAVASEVLVTFIEGWRYEEIIDYLSESQFANIDPLAFRAIVERRSPLDLSVFGFLASLPAQATLEGYLFPDTYRLSVDAVAADLVTEMLSNFDRRFDIGSRRQIASRGLTVHQAVTLASIVEREAVVPFERPTIAGVYLNRLNLNMLLQADPTTQYAVSNHDTGWWKSPLTVEDLASESAYNTYVSAGLPPGPIANPGLAALLAVVTPEQTQYLFFVAECLSEVEGTHDFSYSYEEHLAKVEGCR